MNPDERAIRELVRDWHRATAAGDVEAVLLLMQEDAVFLVPNQPPMRGRAAFERALRTLLASNYVESTGEIQEVEVSGDLAYCWTQLQVSVIPKSGGTPTVRSGHAVSVLRRQGDATWLLARDTNLLTSSGSNPVADSLHASGPNAEHRDKLMPFGPLVGSWDLDVIYYDGSGAIRRRTPGEWHFGWALEGRAIVDVWIVPPRPERPAEGPPPGEYGATVRFYDPRIDAWRSTWHGPVHGIVWPFLARQMGDEIVLERTQENGTLARWIFSQIQPTSFHWRAVASEDSGKTWRLEQEMRATRRH
ncbi:MAG: SgcJ/EcaC family oxidoreductase [Bacillota bacterium]|nr:SgcJ/EcaC family oxidoreductase [Bacillota bacterium]